jgi:hypothetical protein
VKTKHSVRQSLFFQALVPFLVLGALTLHAEKLPEIDAQEFQITPLETSVSGRVYRLQVEGGNPRTGDILLVQKDQSPVAAFRVLKTEGTQIIAKRVRKYESQLKLELNQKYSAVQKIADLVEMPVEKVEPPSTAPISTETPLPPPPSTPDEAQAPAELEPLTLPPETADPNVAPLMGDDGSQSTLISKERAAALDQYDEGLDATTTPRNLKTLQTPPEAPPTETTAGPGVIEHEPLSKFNHMIGLSVGSFRNMSGFSIPGSNNYGFSVYYNRILEDSVWFEGHAPHDTLSWETGLGYYSRVNFTGAYDDYQIIPIRGELLYTLHLSRSFAVLTHVGAQFNWVFAAENALDEGLSALSGIQANAGMGFLYQMGPQWYIRGDAGLDRIAIGLAVKW